MKIGDEVMIRKSPYSDVMIGTCSEITDIKYNHFGRRKHLYVLGKLTHALFRKHELIMVEKELKTDEAIGGNNGK